MDGTVYFVAGPIVPLSDSSPLNPIEFTEDNGVNNLIRGIKINGGDYFAEDENGNDLPFGRNDFSLDVILPLAQIYTIHLAR